MKSARARAMRMRHPPENSLVFLASIALENPSPERMEQARTSAVVASISSSRSYTCCTRSTISS